MCTDYTQTIKITAAGDNTPSAWFFLWDCLRSYFASMHEYSSVLKNENGHMPERIDAILCHNSPGFPPAGDRCKTGQHRAGNRRVYTTSHETLVRVFEWQKNVNNAGPRRSTPSRFFVISAAVTYRMKRILRFLSAGHAAFLPRTTSRSSVPVVA